MERSKGSSGRTKPSTSQPFDSTEDSLNTSHQTSVVGAQSTGSTESDNDTFKSATDVSDQPSPPTKTSLTEEEKQAIVKKYREMEKLKDPTREGAGQSQMPTEEAEMLAWWYQYVQASLKDKAANDSDSETTSDEVTSSMRVLQWLEGNKKPARARGYKEKDQRVSRYRKEHEILLRQQADNKQQQRQLQQQQQDSSLRGPLSIRPSYIEFVQKISKGKAEPTAEELEKEWPPDSEMFMRIISTPVSTDKKEDTDSERTKPPEKDSSPSVSKKSKKSKSSVGSKKGKGKKGSKGKKASKDKKGKKGSIKKGRGSRASKASKGGKQKKEKEEKSPSESGVEKAAGRANPDKEKTVRLSLVEVNRRQSNFESMMRKGSMERKSSLTKILKNKTEKQPCNIPAAIHLYYGDRGNFYTEGELEELRQQLNKVSKAWTAVDE